VASGTWNAALDRATFLGARKSLRRRAPLRGQLMTKEQAIKASKHGAYAAFVSGGITALFLLVDISSDAASSLMGITDNPLRILDLAIMLGCGIGMLRNSRAPAVVVCVYFAFGTIITALSVGLHSSLALRLIFLFFFGNAIRGSTVLHKTRRAENANQSPDKVTPPNWIYRLGLPGGLATAFVAAIGLATIAGNEVVSGAELPRNEYNELLQAGIISEDEILKYFYSESSNSILEAGNILTDQRVIGYFTDESGERRIYDLGLADVASVELVQQGNLVRDSLYQINSHDPKVWIQVLLSNKNEGDLVFVEALRPGLVR
jgi:hypothetical protein